MAPLITLTTDFGNADGYQGVLEGVIAGINPEARVSVLSHEVPPGDITGANYLLKTHYHYFPAGTIHLGIVDPGVGTNRNILVLQTKKYLFVGPDNGLFSFLDRQEIQKMHTVTNKDFMLSEISPVFHGRDVMAPAAAYLSRGEKPALFGRSTNKMIRLTGNRPRKNKGKIIGRVIWCDRFGNLISNIEAGDVKNGRTIHLDTHSVGPIRQTFSNVKPGEPLAFIGSGGHLEIAVRNGSARDFFNLQSLAECQIQVA